MNDNVAKLVVNNDKARVSARKWCEELERVNPQKYRERDILSFSSIKDALTSPSYFHKRHISKIIPDPAPSDAMRLGTVVHDLVFPWTDSDKAGPIEGPNPDEYPCKDYQSLRSWMPKNGLKGSGTTDSMLQQIVDAGLDPREIYYPIEEQLGWYPDNHGRYSVPPEIMAQGISMATQVQRAVDEIEEHIRAKKGIKSGRDLIYRNEPTLNIKYGPDDVVDEESKNRVIELKCRPDRVYETTDFIELKTFNPSRGGSLSSLVKNSTSKYSYDTQLVLYAEAIMSDFYKRTGIDTEATSGYWIFVTSTPNPEVLVYEIPILNENYILGQGKNKLVHALKGVNYARQFENIEEIGIQFYTDQGMDGMGS